jgi:hypothetical protein
MGNLADLLQPFGILRSSLKIRKIHKDICGVITENVFSDLTSEKYKRDLKRSFYPSYIGLAKGIVTELFTYGMIGLGIYEMTRQNLPSALLLSAVGFCGRYERQQAVDNMLRKNKNLIGEVKKKYGKY